jgi:CubicO group peptidase (beta-lactamase class C family)
MPWVISQSTPKTLSCLSKIDAIVAEAIAQREFPGCVVCVGKRDTILHLKAYGKQGYERWAPRMTLDTIFDLASLTKPIATATCIMLMHEKGHIGLDDPIVKFFPDFESKGKKDITIRDLLLHKSGLTYDNALADYKLGQEEALKKLCEMPCNRALRDQFIYLDVHYVLLGEIIKKVMGKAIDIYVDEVIFRPLALCDTGFGVPAWRRRRVAPTGVRNGRALKGEVHDTRAHLLGGVAGHAGLFSTASDIARYAQMMLQEGGYHDRVSKKCFLLKPATVARMTKPVSASNGQRALGWDMQSEHSTNRAAGMTSKAFGHGGFTGVSLWIDPELDLFYIVLEILIVKRSGSIRS